MGANNLKKESKWKFSQDHIEIVEDAWGGIPEGEREEVLGHLCELIRERYEGELPAGEVFRQGWAHGFMYALACMESGVLVPMGAAGDN